eukprot:7029814-Prymnesium_polylepis.3
MATPHSAAKPLPPGCFAARSARVRACRYRMCSAASHADPPAANACAPGAQMSKSQHAVSRSRRHVSRRPRSPLSAQSVSRTGRKCAVNASHGVHSTATARVVAASQPQQAAVRIQQGDDCEWRQRTARLEQYRGG